MCSYFVFLHLQHIGLRAVLLDTNTCWEKTTYSKQNILSQRKKRLLSTDDWTLKSNNSNYISTRSHHIIKTTSPKNLAIENWGSTLLRFLWFFKKGEAKKDSWERRTERIIEDWEGDKLWAHTWQEWRCTRWNQRQAHFQQPKYRHRKEFLLV